MSESILSELMVRISAEVDSSLEAGTDAVKIQLENLTAGFSSLSSAAILTMGAINAETSKLAENMLMVEEMRKRIQLGFSQDSENGKEYENNQHRDTLHGNIMKSAKSTGGDYSGRSPVTIGSVIVNVNGIKKSEDNSGVTVHSQNGKLNIGIPENLFQGISAEVKPLGR